MPEPTHALVDLGWGDRWSALVADRPDGSSPARVLRHDGRAVLVDDGTTVRQTHLLAGVPRVTVGDWVLVDGDSVVGLVEPRRSLLHRRGPDGEEQLLAANVDVVAITCGLDRPVRAGRIERFVALAWDAGASPVVVLTKRDLAVDLAAALGVVAEAAPGIDTAVVSATTGDVDELRPLLAGSTVVVVGESGAGKSTLVNVLAGAEEAETGEVRRGDHKGRHTTTARELRTVGDGICLIDTPGVRAVGLWTDEATVDDVFDDIGAVAVGCRFRDCRHDDEPGCAVRAAVDAGELSGGRLARWHRMRAEVAAAELRADPVERRRAGRRMGKMVREAQRVKPRDR